MVGSNVARALTLLTNVDDLITRAWNWNRTGTATGTGTGDEEAGKKRRDRGLGLGLGLCVSITPPSSFRILDSAAYHIEKCNYAVVVAFSSR